VCLPIPTAGRHLLFQDDQSLLEIGGLANADAVFEN
jgi:hypothetical protein